MMPKSILVLTTPQSARHSVVAMENMTVVRR
jgi:hypothetical protein